MIQLSSCPGSSARTNEDWCAGISGPDGHVLVVLDGVTTPGGDTGCAHGTPWYVNQLGAALLGMTSDFEYTLTDSLKSAINQVAQSHAGTCDVEHYGAPAAAVAIVRAYAGRVDYLVLSDVTVVIDHGGTVEAVSDPRVEAVTKADAAEALKYPIGSTEHSAAIRRMSTNQLARRNHPNGYWVASSSPDAADHAVTGSVKRALNVALLSDGSSRWVDLFEQGSWSEAMDVLNREGPEGLINTVRDIEVRDPWGYTWPRFKTSDDAACAYINLERGE